MPQNVVRNALRNTLIQFVLTRMAWWISVTGNLYWLINQFLARSGQKQQVFLNKSGKV